MKSASCFAILVAVSGAAGCYSKELCDYAECGGAGGSASSSTDTTKTTSSASTQSSSSTGVDPTCIPSEATWSPSESCGVFVKAGASGDGKPGTPVGSLGAAVALGGDKPIYVCAAPDTLSESVERTAPITLFGGLDCATWLPVTDKTTWTAPANSIPLVLRPGANGTHIEGFAITAANATGHDDTTLQGHSSIALLAEGVTATLQRLELTAGTGAPGGDGMNYTEQAPGRQSDAASFDGDAGDVCAMTGGVSVTVNTCPTGGLTSSGKGGDGDLSVGSPGNPGAPDPGLGDPNGEGGVGEPSMGTWSCGADGDVIFPRFRGHPNWRDNAPGAIHGQTKEVSSRAPFLHAGVQG